MIFSLQRPSLTTLPHELECILPISPFQIGLDFPPLPYNLYNALLTHSGIWRKDRKKQENEEGMGNHILKNQ